MLSAPVDRQDQAERMERSHASDRRGCRSGRCRLRGDHGLTRPMRPWPVRARLGGERADRWPGLFVNLQGSRRAQSNMARSAISQRVSPTCAARFSATTSRRCPTPRRRRHVLHRRREANHTPGPGSGACQLESAWSRLYDASRRISAALPVRPARIRSGYIGRTSSSPHSIFRKRRHLYSMISSHCCAPPRALSMLRPLQQLAAFENSPYAMGGEAFEKFAHGTGDLITTMVQPRHGAPALEPVTHVTQRTNGSRSRQLLVAGLGLGVCGGRAQQRDPAIKFEPELSEDKRVATAENHVGRDIRSA